MADQRDRNFRSRALQRNLLDFRRVEGRKDLVVLPPVFAERLLPIVIGFDAVAIADVDGGRARETGGGAFECRNTPFVDLAHEDIKGWFIELDDIDAEGFEFACFLVEQVREGHGHIGAATVVLVGDGVADCHRAGQRDLEPALGVGADKGCIGAVDGFRALQLRRHGRHVDGIAIVADAHLGLLRPVDTGDMLNEAVHEVDAELLAIGDDVDADVVLQLEPDQGCVALHGLKRRAGRAPRRPELFGFSEPGGLWQAASQRGRK